MRRKGVDEGWTALEEMQRLGVPTDKYTVSRMLMKTVGDGRTRLNPTRIYRGISLVEKFIETQPKDVDEVLFNAVLDTCCRLKDLPRLEATVQRMRELHVHPSPVTLGILVKTYGQAGDLTKVLQIWDDMEKQRGQANAVTYGCMIDACVKCGHLNKAVEIFKGMRDVGKHRNTIIYTTLIKGYGLENDLVNALALFREMPREGVPYNTITYNSILDACIKCGDLATAESLLRDITAPESTLEPDLITFSTLLKGYCQAGHLDEALQVVEAIKGRGLRCDELVYNTLMDGCVKANDVATGVGLFEEMIQNKMRPSAITHSILARLYQRGGYEEDAAEAVAQLYQHHGIERPIGGDRSKGLGRRGHRRDISGRHEASSSLARGGPNMTSTPTPKQLQRERSESCWGSTWSEAESSSLPGFHVLADVSAPPTPLGSPMAAAPATAGPFHLPVEASARGIPLLPGSYPSGADTPYASSCGGQTPLVGGSLIGSPISTPGGAGSDSHQQSPSLGVMVAVPASPAIPSVGAVVGSQSPAMAALPPWPFACGASTPVCAAVVATPHDDNSAMQHVVGLPMLQPAPLQAPPSQTATAAPAVTPHGEAVIGDGPVGACHSGACQHWLSQQPQSHSSQFSMLLSPPNDTAFANYGSATGYGFTPSQALQAHAYFEAWSPEGQQQLVVMQTGSQVHMDGQSPPNQGQSQGVSFFP